MREQEGAERSATRRSAAAGRALIVSGSGVECRSRSSVATTPWPHTCQEFGQRALSGPLRREAHWLRCVADCD